MSVMRFKLFGTEIYVSFLFAAVITVMLATDRTGLVLPALFAVFMHEIGHLFAMWVAECAPKQIRLIPASVQIVRGLPKRKGGELTVALCGPAANIILFITLYINYASFGNETSLYYALLNLVIGVFNLLPMNGLDGGTVLYLMLCRKHEIYRAALIMRIITAVSAAAVLVTAVLMAINGKINISLFIIGIYFLITALIKM